MCFDTTKSSRAKIAEEDIICWKRLKRGTKYLRSPYRNTIYKEGVVQKLVPVVKLNVYYGYEIHKGYHSYKTKCIAEHECWFHKNDIFQCIIPKGTRYYTNRKEYVSETIILQP